MEIKNLPVIAMANGNQIASEKSTRIVMQKCKGLKDYLPGEMNVIKATIRQQTPPPTKLPQ